MYRERVIEFIKRKNEALCHLYIPGRTAEAMSTHLDLTIRQQRKMKALASEVDQLITQLKRRQGK